MSSFPLPITSVQIKFEVFKPLFEASPDNSENYEIVYNLRAKASSKGVVYFKLYWTEDGVERVFISSPVYLMTAGNVMQNHAVSGTMVINPDAGSTVFYETKTDGADLTSEYKLTLYPRLIQV